MAHIETLVKDIYSLMDGTLEPNLTEEVVDRFAQDVASIVKSRIMEAKRVRSPELRMSQMGSPCVRKLWYGYHKSELKEDLKPWTLIKFLYGDVIEALFLMLAEAAGHDVKGRQTKLEVEGIPGSRDCIIDGVLVDVKSANSRGFEKFKHHKLETDDPFGYLTQLSLYLEGSKDDVLLEDKETAAFLAIDKELGHVVLDRYRLVAKGIGGTKEAGKGLRDQVRKTTVAILDADVTPDRAFTDRPDGKSGNMVLGTVCKYCDFKKTCWPTLRTFKYANGPVYFTDVKREPNVEEILS
jgi:hypothetical protein